MDIYGCGYGGGIRGFKWLELLGETRGLKG